MSWIVALRQTPVIHYHANIRKCLQYAFQIGMIRSNPADRVERPRKEKFKSEIYSGEELEQLFKVIQGDPSELWRYHGCILRPAAQ